jgi:hypothetical protein
MVRTKEQEQISWVFTMIEAGVETDYMVWPYKIANETNVRNQLKRDAKAKQKMIKAYRLFADKSRKEFYPTMPRNGR